MDRRNSVEMFDIFENYSTSSYGINEIETENCNFVIYSNDMGNMAIVNKNNPYEYHCVTLAEEQVNKIYEYMGIDLRIGCMDFMDKNKFSEYLTFEEVYKGKTFKIEGEEFDDLVYNLRRRFNGEHTIETKFGKYRVVVKNSTIDKIDILETRNK